MSDRSRTLTDRINKVERKIFPPNSVAAKIRALSEADRAIFDRHRQACAEWTTARPGEKAYAALLAGEHVPELPPRLAASIYPVYQQSLSAEENYMNLVESMRCS